MILRRTSSPSPNPTIGNPIDSLAKDLIQEKHIIRDHTGSQMMFHSVQAVDDGIDLAVVVGYDDLEGAEELF